MATLGAENEKGKLWEDFTTLEERITNNNSQNTNNTENSKRKGKRTTKCEETMESIRLQDVEPYLADGSQIAITYSVFVGNPEPDNPKLDHFITDTTVTDKLLEIGKTAQDESEASSADGPNEGNLEIIMRCLAGLARRYNIYLLELPPLRCSVCVKPLPLAAVHRFLFCSLDGYNSKTDGPVMHRVMRQVAECVLSINSEVKMAEALGEKGRGPYIHEIVAPVCSEESECHEIATRNVNDFVEEITKKAVASISAERDERELAEEMLKMHVSPKKDHDKKMTVYVKGRGFELVDDNDNDESKELFPDAANYIQAGMVAPPNNLVKFHVSVFVGRPILAPYVTPRRGRISSLIFTSNWPTSFAPDGKNYEQEYQNYRVIAGYHNKHILEAAQFHCAMCEDEKPAQHLVHQLISFKRDNTVGPQSAGIKRSVMALFQFVEGTWPYPKMIAALGHDGDCHINEWVVPICSRNSNCQALAKIATKEAIKRLMPTEARPESIDEFPDTTFSRPFSQVIGGEQPELFVRKLAQGVANSDGKVVLKAPGKKVLDREVNAFYKDMQVLVEAEKERQRVAAARRSKEEKEANAKAEKTGEEEKTSVKDGKSRSVFPKGRKGKKAAKGKKT